MSRYMYWSDWATVVTQKGKIERAAMDGSKREAFVTVDVHWPNGLSIDYGGKWLYWCDAYYDRIERIGTNKKGRQVRLKLLLIDLIRACGLK
jgi:sugar lactone lactonase YvrE